MNVYSNTVHYAVRKLTENTFSQKILNYQTSVELFAEFFDKVI